MSNRQNVKWTKYLVDKMSSSQNIDTSVKVTRRQAGKMSSRQNNQQTK